MSKKRETVQTSFNLNDDFERSLYEYVKAQGPASKFIKRLIFMHKEGYSSPTDTKETPTSTIPVMDEIKKKALLKVDI